MYVSITSAWKIKNFIGMKSLTWNQHILLIIAFLKIKKTNIYGFEKWALKNTPTHLIEEWLKLTAYIIIQKKKATENMALI